MSGKVIKKKRKQTRAFYDALHMPKVPLIKIAYCAIENFVRSIFHIKPLNVRFQEKGSFKQFFRRTKRNNS